jgi:hypothetical protein
MHQVPVACPDTPFLFSKMKQFLDNIPKRFADSEKQRLYEHYFGSRFKTFSSII